MTTTSPDGHDRRRSDPVVLQEIRELAEAVREQNETTARLADAIVDVNEIRRDTTHLAEQVHAQGVISLSSAAEFHDARRGILMRVAVGLVAVILGVAALTTYLVHAYNVRQAARSQSSRVSCEKRNETGLALDAYFAGQIAAWSSVTVVPAPIRSSFIASNEKARKVFRIPQVDCAKTWPGTVFPVPAPTPSA